MKRTTRIPVKASHNSSSSSSRALVFPSTSSVVSNQADGGGGHDEVKKFCAEGTPSWVSKSNSQTNLSSLLDDDHQSEEEDDSDESADELLQGLVKKAWDANPPKAVAPPVAAARRSSSSKLGQRIAGEGIPTTQANRGLGGITTIPCPTPAASTPHRHGKGIACSTTTSHDKPRYVFFHDF